MATPPPNNDQGNLPQDDVEVASVPSVQTDGEAMHRTQSDPVPSVSHDSSRYQHNQSDDESMATMATMGTMTSNNTASRKAKETGSFLMLMQNMLTGGAASVASGSEPVSQSPMRGHSYNTLDSAADRHHEDFSDEQNRQNWDNANTVPEGGDAAADGVESVSGLISIQNDPSLCSTPPRTRIDPEHAPSLDPPATNGTPKSPRSPPRIAKSSNTTANSPFGGLFRRPPPGPESSDDELKESLVMENQTQGWFGGLLHTPDRSNIHTLKQLESHKEIMDTTLPETPPGKTEYEHFSSVESNEDEEEDDGYKIVAEKNTVQVRLIYFVILFFFLLVIIGGLAYFLWYLSDMETQQSNQARDFVATMRPTTLATKEPSMTPSTSAPSISASPTTTAYPTKSPTLKPTTKRPTRRPTLSPTKTPTNYPTVETRDLNFMNIMASISPETAIKMEAPGTTQNQAFQWLIKDPGYENYSTDRKIQRWVLALVKLETRVTPPETDSPTNRPTTEPTMAPTTLSPTQYPTRPPVDKPISFFSNLTNTAGNVEEEEGDGGRRLNWDALESWMKYTDECQWFTSYYFNRVSCNAMHQFKRLVLINLDLEGTIPTEISLMSRLETIALPQNRITGTIPTEFGSLRWLNTFNVSYNAMDGRIPEQLASAPALANLDVGNNNLRAPVPSRICQKGLRVFRGDCSELECPCCNRCAR